MLATIEGPTAALADQHRSAVERDAVEDAPRSRAASEAPPPSAPVLFGVGAGAVLIAQGNLGGGPAVDGLVDFALTQRLHVRLGASLAVGSFPSTAWEEKCESPGGELYFVQQWSHGDRQNDVALAPTVSFSLRLEPTTFYAVALGLRAGAILFPDPPGGEPTACGENTVQARQRLWLAPELSLLSFRFGSRRQLELESSGGLLLPTEGAGIQDHQLPGNGLGGYAVVTFRHLF